MVYKYLIGILYCTLSFACLADEIQESLLKKVQAELKFKKVELTTNFEEFEFESIKPINGNFVSFVPQIGTNFSCGLIMVQKEEPEILFTLQFVKETQEWTPINGKPIEKEEWVISQ